MNIDVLREEIAADEGVKYENIQRSSWILNLWDRAFGKETDVEHGFAVDTLR